PVLRRRSGSAMSRRHLEWQGSALFGAALAALLALGAAAVAAVAAAGGGEPPPAAVPLGLPPVPVPAANPLTPAKIALGEKLFFDPGLSTDRHLSCGRCAQPDH